MKVSYFEDTDTLYVAFREGAIVESRDLDANTVIDVDANGNCRTWLRPPHAR